MKKVLVILGHPNKESLCAALAESYANGAVEAGAEVRKIILGDLHFDPILHRGYKEIQNLEPDLTAAQEAIKWAEHIVFAYPTWWGTMPALLKGFIDRTFLPGFAFKYRKNSSRWDKYLSGKTGRLIVTMDAPLLYDRLVYGAAGRKSMKRATLQFSGIKPVRITAFGSVKFASDDKRQKWIKKVYALGGKMI